MPARLQPLLSYGPGVDGDYQTAIEIMPTAGGPVFDSLLATEIGAVEVLNSLLDPQRLNRLEMQHATDRDDLRYSISGEGGLNDGTAFPFVMLGLGLLGLHPDAESGLLGLWGAQPFRLGSWFGWDLLWAVTAGLVVGGATGWLVGDEMAGMRAMRGASSSRCLTGRLSSSTDRSRGRMRGRVGRGQTSSCVNPARRSSWAIQTSMPFANTPLWRTAPFSTATASTSRSVS